MASRSITAPPFAGPVFVVGLPRSGTKLLRDLLNGNPRVSIPEVETHFLPYLLRKYGSPTPFLDPQHFKRFGNDLRGSTFFENMRQRGIVLDLDDLFSGADVQSWSAILESLLRHFGPKPISRDVVFGDKTPDYLKAMDLLRAAFPHSRFVHIIRDPRDMALSAWKAWGQHPYRSAHRWQEAMAQYRPVGEAIGGYLEVSYEDLLADPSTVLTRVCHFLDCEFAPDMLVLRRPSENLGDARGIKSILSKNVNKYWLEFPEAKIQRIEEIAYQQMRILGYPIYLAEQSKPLGGTFSLVLQVSDLAAMMRSKIQSRGLVGGTRYVWSQRRKRVRA